MLRSMKPQRAILELFKEDPHCELSTSEIVKKTETETYNRIKNKLNDSFSDQEQIKKAKRKKAQLHRKILYHLNKLIEEDILKVTREGKRGEKFFTLNLEEGEKLTVDKFGKKSTVTISKPQAPAIPIEGYEQKGIVHKLKPATWIERLNSLLIECPMFDDLERLLHFVSKCFSNINDTLALNNLENLFEGYESKKIINFARKLNSRCADYGKKVNFIIDISKINKTKEKDIINFIKNYLNFKEKQIDLIFNLTSKQMQAHSVFFEEIIDMYSRTDVNLYIKNNELHEAPYIVGRAGPYTLDEKEWRTYEKELKGDLYCIVCAHATIMVDTDKFFREESRDVDSFRAFNLKIANALLSTNSIQRRRSEEFFSDLVKLNKPHVKDLFIFSKNYIRFWNYGWKRDDFDQDLLLELFRESKKAVDRFCISEDTIYKSCGMPTRFVIAFSCAFEKFVKNIFSKAKYKRFKISGMKDFYKQDIENILETKERLFDFFDGGDLITFYRVGNLNIREILREISFILNTYKIPFFRWNFGNGKEKDATLEKYMHEN